MRHSAGHLVFGVLVTALGSFMLWPSSIALMRYIDTGEIVFDPRNGPPIYGLEAACWHAVVMLMGAWVATYGLAQVIRPRSKSDP